MSQNLQMYLLISALCHWVAVHKHMRRGKHDIRWTEGFQRSVSFLRFNPLVIQIGTEWGLSQTHALGRGRRSTLPCLQRKPKGSSQTRQEALLARMWGDLPSYGQPCPAHLLRGAWIRTEQWRQRPNHPSLHNLTESDLLFQSPAFLSSFPLSNPP